MGTLIGVERQFRQRNAGLRTNILVSVGAAAFTVLSYAMTAEEGDPLVWRHRSYRASASWVVVSS